MKTVKGAQQRTWKKNKQEIARRRMVSKHAMHSCCLFCHKERVISRGNLTVIAQGLNIELTISSYIVACAHPSALVFLIGASEHLLDSLQRAVFSIDPLAPFTVVPQNMQSDQRYLSRQVISVCASPVDSIATGKARILGILYTSNKCKHVFLIFSVTFFKSGPVQKGRGILCFCTAGCCRHLERTHSPLDHHRDSSV